MAPALHREYAGEDRAPGAARHDLADYLAGEGMTDEFISDAVVAASELVMNACIHAQGPITLHAASAGEALRVEVRDHGGNGQHRHHDDGSGLGLGIIRTLTNSNGYTDHDGTGRTAWFEMLHR